MFVVALFAPLHGAFLESFRMHPIHDTDPLLLLAVSLAAKRRPAALEEVVAAIDLMQEKIPGESKFIDTIARLAVAGLLHAPEGGLALTAAGESLIAPLPRKAEAGEQLLVLKQALAAYMPSAEQPPVVLANADVLAAFVAQRTAAKSTAKNLLVPKPKTADTSKARPGQRQRKPMPARRKP